MSKDYRPFNKKIPFYPNIIVQGYQWLSNNGYSAKYTDKYRFYRNRDEVSWDVLVTATAKHYEEFVEDNMEDQYGYLINWFYFPKNYDAIRSFLMSEEPGLERDNI